MSKQLESLNKNVSFLKLLQETKSNQQRCALLETATPSQIRALSEICQHILTGHCKINKDNRKHLRSKANIIQKIASPIHSYKSKKRRVSQSGGAFLSILAPLLGAVLPAILSK